MKDNNKAYLLAISAVVFWSTVATAFKLALRSLDFIQLLFLSSCTSLLTLICLNLLRNKGKVFTFLALPKQFPDNSNRDAPQLFQNKSPKLKFFLTEFFWGSINPFFYYLVLFSAYNLLRAQEAQAINYTWGITMAILSVFILRQKLGIAEIIGIAISYFGVFIISVQGKILQTDFSNIRGVLLAFVSTFIWASYWINRTRSKKDLVDCLIINFFSGTLLSFAALLLFSDFNFTRFGVTASVYIGVFEMGLTFFIWNKALQLTNKISRISTLIFLSPFLSLFFIRFFLGETILWSTVAGLLLIITGLLLQNKSQP
ncbi:MAG: DMT family transporter [Deltaproteobacteria bacterium]|jgi:drug/metabolite transporter (DMT)-like permease|nr:DMT family transporter [Deltaproteobacteria bacterium]